MRPPGRLPVVFMFSGQGAQYHHMGRELLEREPVFRDWMERANERLRVRHGVDVLAFLYDPAKSRSTPFEELLYSHPAIFMLEYALAQVLLARGRRPDCVLGSSLGEFAAAAVSGVLGFEEALDAVMQHARIVRAYCPEGGMTAVLADESLFGAERALHGGCELAASNFPGNFVIAGAKQPLRAAEAFLREHGIRFQQLPVPYAFHSSLVDPAAPPFLEYLQRLPLRPPALPFISCAQAGFLERMPPGHFWRVGREPIHLHQTLEALGRDGPLAFVDLGPSGTLAACVKYGLPPGSGSTFVAAMTPFGNDLRTLAAVEASLPASR